MGVRRCSTRMVEETGLGDVGRTDIDLRASNVESSSIFEKDRGKGSA